MGSNVSNDIKYPPEIGLILLCTQFCDDSSTKKKVIIERFSPDFNSR